MVFWTISRYSKRNGILRSFVWQVRTMYRFAMCHDRHVYSLFPRFFFFFFFISNSHFSFFFFFGASPAQLDAKALSCICKWKNWFNCEWKWKLKIFDNEILFWETHSYTAEYLVFALCGIMAKWKDAVPLKEFEILSCSQNELSSQCSSGPLFFFLFQMNKMQNFAVKYFVSRLIDCSLI